MDESSGAGDSSPSQESIPKVWQCTYCQATASGMKPGYVPKFCFDCGKAQIKCVNPKCNELLFSDKAEFCHKCHAPQQPQGTNGDGIKDSDPEKGNAKKGDKPDERLSSDNIKPTAPPDSHESSSDKTPSAAVQQSPASDLGDNVTGGQQQAHKGDDQKSKLDGDKTPPKMKTDQSETEMIPGQSKPQRKSSTLDSEESSDSEEYHTPSPDKDKEDEGSKGATGDDQSNNSIKDVSQINQPLTRLSIREHRKHERDESVGDSDDSNPTKKKALGDKKPPLSPTARDSATLDTDEEKDSGKQKNLMVKGGQQQEKIKSEVTKHPLQEDSATEMVEVHQKSAKDEQSLFEGTAGGKKKKKKKKGKSDENPDDTPSDVNKNKRESTGPITRSKAAATVELDVRGFFPPPERTLEITFHVLVPTDAWNWGKNSYMCMQFDHPKLGLWRREAGEFKMIRDVGDGLREMECTLAIDSDLLKHQAPVCYKYLVYSQHKGDTEYIPYEFLHGAPGGGKIVNRKIFIPSKKFHPKGSFHQYDSMAYPETKTKGVFVKAWDALKDMVGKGSTDELIIPDHTAMQTKALNVYLEKYEKVLVDCQLSPQFNIIRLSEKVEYIFRQLYAQLLSTRDNPWIANGLTEVMGNWLFAVTEKLHAKEIKCLEDSGRRMASILAVLLSFDRLVPLLTVNSVGTDTLEAVLSLLYLRPDIEHSTHRDLDVVYSLIPKADRKMVSDALIAFCTSLSHRKLFERPSWLYAIPLVHFLRGTSAPFQKPELNPEKMTWGEKGLGLIHVRQETNEKNYGIVEGLFDDLKPLTLLDPLFLSAFVFVCPKPELPLLFLQIPSCFSIAWLARLVKDHGWYNRSELEEFTAWIEVLIDVLPTEERGDAQTVVSALQGSVWLFSQFISKIRGTDSHHLKALKALVSLLLGAASKVLSLRGDNRDRSKAYTDEVNKAVRKIHDPFKGWVRDKLSGADFGGSYVYFNQEGHVKDELKFWNFLVRLNCPSEEVLALWHGEIVKIVRERYTRLKHEKRIEYFGMVESQDTHDLITNVLLECVMQSIEEMTMKDTAASVSRLYSSNASRKKKEAVGKILEAILTKQYPKADGISFDQLLEWDLWPSFIVVFSKLRIK